MPQAPDQFQPANPNQPPGMGMAEQPHPFWKALEGVVSGLRNMQMSQGSTNPWGMHEPTLQAAQAIGPGFSKAGEIMSDPRNAWMGMGPAMGMAAMGRGMRGAGNAIKDLGGFSAATPDIRQALGVPRPNLRMGETSSDVELPLRQAYTDKIHGMNLMGETMQNLRDPRIAGMRDYFYNLHPEEQKRLSDVMKGRQELIEENQKAFDPRQGGGMPPMGYGH